MKLTKEQSKETQPILNKEEKEWLESTAKIFKKKIKFVYKIYDIKINEEYIYIVFSNEGIALPYFKVNTMFKGMECTREYTPKELGLFK